MTGINIREATAIINPRAEDETDEEIIKKVLKSRNKDIVSRDNLTASIDAHNKTIENMVSKTLSDVANTNKVSIMVILGEKSAEMNLETSAGHLYTVKYGFTRTLGAETSSTELVGLSKQIESSIVSLKEKFPGLLAEKDSPTCSASIDTRTRYFK